MILILELHDSSSKLRKVVIYNICQLIAGKHSLFLKNADMTPSLDYLRLNVPQCSITQKIGVIVEESCRSDDFPVAGTLDIHHLSRLGAHEHNKTIRLALLGESGYRGA